MTDYRQLTEKECAKELLGIKNPVVVMHMNPDADTVGSSVALCKAYEALGIKAYYACADKIPERLKFLTDGIEPADEEDFGRLTPVAVDVASSAQLGRLAELLPKFALMIDHHELGSPFANFYNIKGASSAGEVVYRVLRVLEDEGRIKLTKQITYPLYAAISSDTGCFKYSSATPDTYRVAAELMETGIDYSEINHLLFSSKTEKQLKAEGFVSSVCRVVAGGKVAYACIEQKDLSALAVDMEDFETAVDIVRSVMGVEVAFVVKEKSGNGIFRVSLRSTGADVSRVAAEFGGGGHIRASGCAVSAENAAAAAEAVIAKLIELGIAKF